MVGIAGDVAGGGTLHSAGRVGEAVPDGFALAVFSPSAFDLIGGGGRAPDEFAWKLERRVAALGLGKFAEEAMAGRHDRERSDGTKSSGDKFTAVEVIPLAHGLPPRLW